MVGQLTVNDDGTSTLQTANVQLDEMSDKGGNLQSVLMGVASGFTFAFVTTALSAIKGAGDALLGFIGDSLAAADKHDKALAQINAALKSNTAVANTATQSGGQWVKTQDLSSKATASLQKKIDSLNQSIANTNEKDALMGKTTKATTVSLIMKNEKLTDLNNQLAAGTKAHTVWVNSVAAEKPVVQMTLDGIEKLTKGMSRKTLFSQDQYLAASQYLIQMRTIGKDVFPQAMQATADLATRMNVDLSSAAQTVSKALANPAMGVGRLNMQFKLFNAEQLKSLQYMSTHGQLAKAQTTIMDALTKAVGGSAQAAAEAGLGPWQLLQNQFEDIKDQVGEALIPAIDNIGRVMGPIIDSVMPQFGAILSDVVGPALTQVSTTVGYFIQDIMAGKKPMDALNDALWSSGVDPATIKSINDFAQGVSNFVAGIPAAIKGITDFVTNVANVPTQIATQIALWITSAQTAITGFTQVGKDIVTNITKGIDSVHDTPAAKNIQQQVNDAGVAIAGFIGTGIGIVTNITTGIAREIATVSTNIATGVTQAATDLAPGIGAFVAKGTLIITNIKTGITTTIASVGTELAKGPTGWIADATKAVSGFVDVGKAIISGIVTGITSNVASVITAVVDACSGVIKAGLHALGIGSPSKVFADIGKNTMLGFQQGLSKHAMMPTLAMTAATGQLIQSVAGSSSANTTNHYYFGAATYEAQGSPQSNQMQMYRG